MSRRTVPQTFSAQHPSSSDGAPIGRPVVVLGAGGLDSSRAAVGSRSRMEFSAAVPTPQPPSPAPDPTPPGPGPDPVPPAPTPGPTPLPPDPNPRPI